jgi:hypothetical protein
MTLLFRRGNARFPFSLEIGPCVILYDGVPFVSKVSVPAESRIK